MRHRTLLLAALLWTFAAVAVSAEPAAPRTIVALVDVAPSDTLKYSRVHQMATMPLNHLGLTVELHNMSEGLPDLTGRDDVRGILTWFTTSNRPGAYDYLEWAEKQVAAGRRYVILGELGALVDQQRGTIPTDRVNRFLEHIGVDFEGSSIPFSVGLAYQTLDVRYWAFEERPPLPPPYSIIRLARKDATAHVVVQRANDPDSRSAVVVTSPGGGFVADGYIAELDPGSTIRRWLINPFRFFARAFDTDDLPKPDTTTLVGRRVFYSHVDGDGWRNPSEVKLDGKLASSPEVLMERIARRFPDLPVTIAPIAAELDPAWIDSPTARDSARRLFALPNVEPGSHTYTHPFQWSFFRNYDAKLEHQIVETLGVGGQSMSSHGVVADGVTTEPTTDTGTKVNKRYEVPRAFYLKPFDLALEIAGSFERIGEFTGGHPVALMQWSGDTTPFEAALRAAREAGVPNINGGDTRFDSDYPSYGFVAPIGVKVGAERQIYASNSNENTYTDLWSGRFFGYRHLQETLRRTETPIRVKPINIYYHSYSAERVASLNAVVENLEFARRQQIVPIKASHFARIAGGFYQTRLVPLDGRRWRVENRGALQTIRFDRAALTTVDFERSSGVVGARGLQGSLYVALDPAVEAPVIALSERERSDIPAVADRPYLLDSRWPVSNVEASGSRVQATVGGFGDGEMTWIVPRPGRWTVTLDDPGGRKFDQTITVGDDNRLPFTLPAGRNPERSFVLTVTGG